jgi:hypothetical protein
MSEAHYLRSMHSRGFYPKAHRVSSMDFELHPTVSLKGRSFNVLIASREHFISMLNRKPELAAIQGSFCYRQLLRHFKSAASEAHGDGDKKRFQSNVKIKGLSE